MDECIKNLFVLPKSKMCTCPSGQAMEKIIEDQEEFEKEHQFMQVKTVPFPDFFHLQVQDSVRFC